MLSEKEKKNFRELINIYIKRSPFLIVFSFCTTYVHLLTIIITIMCKHDTKNNWYLKEFIKKFFFTKNRLRDFELDYNYNGLIRLRKYLKKVNVSTIIKMFIKKTKYKKGNALCLYSFIIQNKKFFYRQFYSLHYLIPNLKFDMKIPNKFESSLSKESQLLYIFCNFKKIVKKYNL